MVDDGDSQRARPILLVAALLGVLAVASLGTVVFRDRSDAGNICKAYGIEADEPTRIGGRLVHLGWLAEERGQCGSTVGHYMGLGDAQMVLWDDCMVSTPDGDTFPAVLADLDEYC